MNSPNLYEQDPQAPIPLDQKPPKKGKFLPILGVLISSAYLLNPGAGLLGEVPDALPIIGNLDEAFFSAMLIGSLTALGIKVPFIKK